MGTAAVLSLALPIAEHILYNIGLIPTGALVLPFFYLKNIAPNS